MKADFCSLCAAGARGAADRSPGLRSARPCTFLQAPRNIGLCSHQIIIIYVFANVLRSHRVDG